jgi:hypothetical protein
MAESTKDRLTEQQEKLLKELNDEIRRRQTVDMMKLVKMPEFLRYLGRITKECGVNRSIDTTLSNDFMRQEGKRSIGEKMVAELLAVSIDAKFEMERWMHKDELDRKRIKEMGVKPGKQ